MARARLGGEIPGGPTPLWLRGIFSVNQAQRSIVRVGMESDPRVRAARAFSLFEQNIDTGFAFLGTDTQWKRELSNPPKALQLESYMEFYGSMSGIALVEQAVQQGKLGESTPEDGPMFQGLSIQTPTQDTIDRATNFPRLSAKEARELLHSGAVGMFVSGEGGGIAQMEMRLILAQAKETQKPTIIYIHVPEKPKKEDFPSLAEYEKKARIWRSRMMQLADAAYTKAEFGLNNMFISTNLSEEEANLGNYQSMVDMYDNTDPITMLGDERVIRLFNTKVVERITRPAKQNSSDTLTVTISGSSEQIHLDARHKLISLLEKLGITPDDTSREENGSPIEQDAFQEGLPQTRIKENERIARGDINIVHMADTFGSVAQAAFAATQDNKYTILYIPEDQRKIMRNREDYQTFYKHLCELAYYHPEKIHYIRVARTPEEVTWYVRQIKESRQTSSSRRSKSNS